MLPLAGHMAFSEASNGSAVIIPGDVPTGGRRTELGGYR